MITEGGNVFKDEQGQARTQRINLADIAPTVKWLEAVTGLPLADNMLGSTGLKPSSGDLDLAVDSTKHNKEDLVKLLSDYVSRHGEDPRNWVRKSGTAVHFLTPIAGRGDTGFVQTDFMFLPKPDFSKFVLRSAQDSEYKGATRNILINSMAKSLGYKLNQLDGIMDRATNRLITDDPNKIAKMLLNPSATANDLHSVETIMAALANDPKRDAKLADFRDHMQRSGTPLGEGADNDVNWMARLRDRIIKQGMQVIVEGVRIEHPEDMVLDMGSRGLNQALQGIVSAAQDPNSTTVKWDGKPAIIFGRKPTGEFVLTDKAGFLSKGYDGLATSPEMLERIMQARGGERGELIAMYKKIFPLLRAAVPQNFRGYVQGDLLYTDRPPVIDGAYEFTPNTVKYRVPVDSELGKSVGASEVGVVVHTQIDQPGGTASAVRAASLAPVQGLLILDPSLKEPRTIKLDPRVIKDLQSISAKYSTAIDRLFDPQELRARKITNLPALIKTYINSRVRSGSYDNLVGGFGPWLQQKEPAKAPRIFQWATENKQGMAAVFQAFLDLSALKNELVRQLDAQGHDVQASINNEPGHEGYVGNGMKYVDRMRFSAANFAKNNPELA
jgi:hypothetical protein